VSVCVSRTQQKRDGVASIMSSLFAEEWCCRGKVAVRLGETISRGGSGHQHRQTPRFQKCAPPLPPHPSTRQSPEPYYSRPTCRRRSPLLSRYTVVLINMTQSETKSAIRSLLATTEVFLANDILRVKGAHGVTDSGKCSCTLNVFAEILPNKWSIAIGGAKIRNQIVADCRVGECSSQ
jgi:hypothetical protein